MPATATFATVSGSIRDDGVVVVEAAAPTDRAATGVLAAVGPAVRRTRRHMA